MAQAQQKVDAYYDGILLGESLQMSGFAGGEARLHHESPMPVGSELEIAVGEQRARVRVNRVVEKVSNRSEAAGMIVGPLELGGLEEWWEARRSEGPEPEQDSASAAPESKEEDVPQEVAVEAAPEAPKKSSDSESKAESSAEESAEKQNLRADSESENRKPEGKSRGKRRRRRKTKSGKNR